MHYNWKGDKNVPANIKQHWIDPEKNLLPRGLLNNNNNNNSKKKKLNATAKNYKTKKKSYANTLKKKSNKKN
jgi:hypothetical protein